MTLNDYMASRSDEFWDVWLADRETEIVLRIMDDLKIDATNRNELQNHQRAPQARPRPS